MDATILYIDKADDSELAEAKAPPGAKGVIVRFKPRGGGARGWTYIVDGFRKIAERHGGVVLDKATTTGKGARIFIRGRELPSVLREWAAEVEEVTIARGRGQLEIIVSPAAKKWAPEHALPEARSDEEEEEDAAPEPDDADEAQAGSATAAESADASESDSEGERPIPGFEVGAKELRCLRYSASITEAGESEIQYSLTWSEPHTDEAGWLFANIKALLQAVKQESETD